MSSFNVIVIGLGGMGSAAAFELARRGHRVLGLEQFRLVHDRGSSHGHTRVIRQAYYEHPAYVPLVQRSFERWYDLEQRTGRHLLSECACLNIGPPDGELVLGVRASAEQHGLPVEEIVGSRIGRRFPAMRFEDDVVGVLEHRAGFLYVEDCVRAHCDAAVSLGAVLRSNEPVIHWKPDGHGVEVTTPQGTYAADSLILTAGPWATRMLGGMGMSLTVMRQTLLWFPPADPTLFRRDRFPIYLADVPGGPVYGLPAIDGRGHKAARHYGAPELPDPDAIDRTVTEDDELPVREFFRRHIPAADVPRSDGHVCTYTLTPDRHFIIDRHPHHPQVAIAAGFSGHGFKFAAVIGELLADLIDTGQTRLPIEMFSAKRFEKLTYA